MKQNSKKYYYSQEEDKVIVDFVKEDFKNRQEARRPYELIWELNMNFYLGNQYSYISNYGEINDIEKRYYWENREVFNHIAPIIESRLAKLRKIKPKLTIKPFGNSENDLYTTKLTKSIINSCSNNNNFSSLISTATQWSEITGTSFYKVVWDNSLGNFVGKIDDKYLKNGDVSISVCSPFEIYPDSNNTQNIEDCESIIEARAYPVKYINEIWDTNLDGEDIDIFEVNNNSNISSISGRSNFSKIIHSKKHNHVLLIERYEKPTQKYPNGKLTIICNNTLLFDGDLPYKVGKENTRCYPFVKQVSIRQVASFWGSSVIERCIPIQRAYNAIKNKKHEFISRLASGILSVEDGSVDVDNLEDEGLAPGKILIYRNGSTPPTFLNPGTIPTELENEENKLLNELNNLSCVSDVTTSNTIPSNINSGSALSLLISQDEARLSLTAEYIREAIKTVGHFIIKLYKQFATTKRLNQLTDSNGKLEIFYWTNSDLNSDDVIFETANELEESSSKNNEILFKLFDLGLLNNNDGTVDTNIKNQMLSVLGFSNFKTSEPISDIHKKRASKENLKLIKLSQPLSIDDHKIHIEEHIRFLISDTSESIDESVRNELLNHIEEHKNLVNTN